MRARPDGALRSRPERLTGNNLFLDRTGGAKSRLQHILFMRGGGNVWQ